MTVWREPKERAAVPRESSRLREEQTIVQRIRIILISSFILALGVFYSLDVVKEIRAGAIPNPLWLLRAILPFLIGIVGLINVFRSKRT